jgi:hypothetical protein
LKWGYSPPGTPTIISMATEQEPRFCSEQEFWLGLCQSFGLSEALLPVSPSFCSPFPMSDSPEV